MSFNSPPNWPPPSSGWTPAPPPGFQPHPSYGKQPKNPAPLIIGGIVAVIAVVAAIVGIVLLTNKSEPSDSASSDSTSEESGPSDEEQIRTVVKGLQNAWNRSDLDAYDGYSCEQDLEQGDRDEETFGAQGNQDDRIDLDIESIEVDGDAATVTIEATDGGGTDTDDYTFLREDDEWKVCFSESNG